MLAADLRRQGHDIVYTRELGGTELGERIRELVLDPRFEDVDPIAELLLCGASRRQHVHQLIGPAMRANKPVICDRYAASTTAYQGAGRGLDSNIVQIVNELAIRECPADLTIVLDVPVSEAIHRREDRAAPPDRLERSGPQLQEVVRDAYRQIVATDPERCLLISGDGAPQDVFTDVNNALIDRWPSFPFRSET